MDTPKSVKRRKITDRTIPQSAAKDLVPDSKLYNNLLDMERKLDWTMTRKRVEIQDALSAPMSATRTLRVFLSHTVSGQAWQKTGSANEDSVDFSTGENIPAWSFKIEGRLLDNATTRTQRQAAQQTKARQFSSCVKSVVIELERNPSLYPDSNIVEWHNPGDNAGRTVDGFNVRRTGDTPTNLRVVLHLQHYPERFKLSPELSELLGITHDSRDKIVSALWTYIKINGLQDKTDRRIVRCDAALKRIAPNDFAFGHLNEVVNRHLLLPEPVLLNYTVQTDEPPGAPAMYDIELSMDDSYLRSRMQTVSLSLSAESLREMSRIDDTLATHAQSLQNSVQKREFLEKFAKNPREFIQNWIASQSRDLEVVLGVPESKVKEEDLRRSEFFTLPWVEEAVAVQEGIRLSSISRVNQ